MDRLILRSQHPSVKAVILPPAFPGAAFLVYVIGPAISARRVHGPLAPDVRVPQKIVGTFPTWEQANALVKFCHVPFLVSDSSTGELQPLTPEFRAPIENPLCDPGLGWHIISDATGSELAVRRSPLMSPACLPEHPYFYAISGRRSKDKVIWTSPHATPHQADFIFPDVDLWKYTRDIDRMERVHEEGFVLQQN